MKTIKQLIFAFILFFAFTSTKAQIAIPDSSGKTQTPKIETNPTTESENTENTIVLGMSKKRTQVQVNGLAQKEKRSKNSPKAETIVSPKQKQTSESDANATSKK